MRLSSQTVNHGAAAVSNPSPSSKDHSITCIQECVTSRLRKAADEKPSLLLRKIAMLIDQRFLAGCLST